MSQQITESVVESLWSQLRTTSDYLMELYSAASDLRNLRTEFGDLMSDDQDQLDRINDVMLPEARRNFYEATVYHSLAHAQLIMDREDIEIPGICFPVEYPAA
ncbi:hypothetical protein EV191_11291 [Tamaricihabitans halophyticus]|uniref:Uncharacterized protein n=1 Tax=Tamaricihabitans halophyticus TaxID=1262583 RepID=A0A4R2QJX9_9PSEU|nr:hypothetical protein [Tamaricihabitans halophyticus]TCP47295.1 hypothetical protein EV191_11291 [Tamaricihabitans halophyticus]